MADESVDDLKAKLQGTKLGEMFELVVGSAEDYLKALDGGKLASTRVRKKMLATRDLAVEIRKEMLESRKKK
jgi:hypothetical protein